MLPWMPQRESVSHIRWWPRLGKAAAMFMLTQTGMCVEAESDRPNCLAAASTMTTLFNNGRPLTTRC
eukprot:1482741-Pyramimonas_sp.AAC.1